MSNALAVTRFWLLDWYGCIIDHDPETDLLIRRGFTSEGYPDLFLLAPKPLRLPMPAVLRKRSSLPRNIPSDLELVDAKDGLVGLRDRGHSTYFSINPRNELTHFNADRLHGWERFTPLTFEVMNGLSNLMDLNRATVLDARGESCSPLNLGENTAILNDFHFNIIPNAEALTTIGELEAGAEAKVTLKGKEGQQETITVKRK